MPFYKGPVNMCTFLELEKFHNVFLQIIIQNLLYKGILLLLLGMF